MRRREGRVAVNRLQRAAVGSIRLYQRWISPAFPSACRFFPSCSEYAAQAISRYGLAYGLWLTCRRLLRCHPYHPGGLDPIP